MDSKSCKELKVFFNWKVLFSFGNAPYMKYLKHTGLHEKATYIRRDSHTGLDILCTNNITVKTSQYAPGYLPKRHPNIAKKWSMRVLGHSYYILFVVTSGQI